MRTHTGVRMAIGAALLALTACGSQASTRSEDSSPTDPSTAAADETPYAGPTIPPGIYTKTFTRNQVRKMGIEPERFDGGFSPRGSALVVYKFGAGTWTQFEGPIMEQLVPGSSGTHHYEDGGDLVISETCCGDTVLTWSRDGRKLTMTLKSSEMDAAPIDHLMRGGVYTKTG